MLRDFKYLTAYLVPLITFGSLMVEGLWCYSTLIFVFIIIPLVEPLLANSSKNLDSEIKESISSKVIFDWLLYLNLPVLYCILFFYLQTISQASISMVSKVGMMLSVGAMMGSIGINVAHELGHKPERFKQLLSKALLLPSLYLHFFIEHNMGHHKRVATDEDPASARKNEPIYTFWIRSVVMSYLHAWKIEGDRLRVKKSKSSLLYHQMVWFTLIQVALVTGIYLLYGKTVLLLFIGSAIFSFLLLETINYVEHYGLRRKKLANGRYERVMPWHSWNSNHELGRIMLYELTRHSDHHYLSNKKYQVLDHHKDAKQLPFGYPTSMILSLFPPLWFKIMNPRL